MEHPYDEDETEELYSRQDDDRVIAPVAKLRTFLNEATRSGVKVGKNQAETEKKDTI